MDKSKFKDDEGGEREKWLSMHESQVTILVSNIPADVAAGKCINLVLM